MHVDGTDRGEWILIYVLLDPGNCQTGTPRCVRGISVELDDHLGGMGLLDEREGLVELLE